MKKVITVVLYVLLLAALAAVVSVAVVYVRNGQRNMYLQYGSQQISVKAENVVLTKGAANVVYVKQLLGWSDETTAVKASDYTVTVGRTDAFPAVDFQRGGITDNSLGLADLTPAFAIERYDGYFTVTPPRLLPMQKLLEALYPGETITGVPEIDLWERDYLQLVVTGIIEDVTISVGFH